MKKRKFSCGGCLLYGCITLLILAVPFWYVCIYAPPLVISEATTRITSPLTADGQVDYFKFLEQTIYPPELATDENGYRDFVRQFGYIAHFVGTDDLEFYRLQMYEKLGLDPTIPPTLILPDEPEKVLRDFYEAKGEKHSWEWMQE